MKIFNLLEVTFRVIPRRKVPTSEKTFIKIMKLADKMTLNHMKECGDYLKALAQFREDEKKIFGNKTS